MKIQDIYDKYKIMPQLRLHMLRVAAVAKVIAQNMTIEVDTNEIVEAELLHDMGNIIKFNLTLYPKTLEPQGLEYWENVKAEFVNKYGEEHTATYKIAEEIGVRDRVMDLIKSVGFGYAQNRYFDKDYSKKICAYSDHRVAPQGVLPLAERIVEGIKRYKANKKHTENHPIHNINKVDLFAEYMKKVEKQIFKHCKIKPEDIIDKSVSGIIEELNDYEIKTVN